MSFKSHMILFSDQEGFTTVCGIDDGCSDNFKDTAKFSNFGDEAKTTCKKCLQRFRKMLTNHDIEVLSIPHSA
jgi:hypothetical protein